MPGELFDRVETAAHIEFAIFLATLVGIAATVRRVLRQRAPLSWAALFLFPGILCYDSGLVLGADHVAALWAAPIFLLCLRYLESTERGYALLLGAVLAGALDTKYTAAILLPLPLVIVLARTVRSRARASSGWTPPLIVAAALVALTSPHWLKNALFYGDPLFPALRRWLPSHPWSAAAEAPYAIFFYLRRPPFSIGSVVEMVKTLVTFSFVPHDFPQYHGEMPVFGSLFTLCTPMLVLFGRQRRLPWLFAGAYMGVAAWFWIHEFDRYLQVLVPWMASATAVTLVLAWREGGIARTALGLLVGIQVVWGAAVPFMPTHRGAGSSIFKVVVDLLGAPLGESDRRTVSYGEWETIGHALPHDAKVLVHEEEIHLGLSTPSVLDYPGDQGKLYWGERGTSSPLQVWNVMRSHGISHVVWANALDHASDTVAGGLVFFDFVTHHTKRIGTYGGFVLAELRDTPPSDTPPGEVAYYPCDPDPRFAPGLYPLEALASDDGRVTLPDPHASMDDAFERARFLVFDARCHGQLPAEVRARFELLAARGHAMMLARRAEP
jgi:hypothetical protein